MAKLNINGKVRDVQVEAQTPLLWVIREQVGLTGTKYGCGVAQCGACSVHLNGEVVRSCSIPVGGVKATDKIVTIEGLSAASSHPVQKAWAELDVPQCGYCQSGQIMAAAATEVNAWVVVKPDNTCVIRIARSEMGQGTLTGLAQLVAEELECDWWKVATEHVFPGQNLARKRIWGDMATGGSRGIRGSQDYVRRGGAAARMMLVQAAADQWKVPVGEVSVSNGVITHAASKRRTTYGRVAAGAAKLAPPDPKSIKLKDPKDWKIAGKPLRRLDTADKLNGGKIYSIDVKLPGMLLAAVKACPVHGGKLVSYDEAKVAKMPGVRRVVKVNDGAVAVVADTWWRAKTALEALPIVWDEGANAAQSSATIAERLKAGLTADDAFADTNIGDALKVIASAPKKVEAVYSTPFLSHATMEPMNCTAKVAADRVEVWTATQSAEGSLAAACEEAGLPLAKGEVHKLDLGGGFGRRGGTQDYTRQAVAIAKQFPGVPVKLIWSREEDQAHDFYRPISQCKLAAGLDESGKLLGMHIRVSGQSINAWLNPGAIKEGKDTRQLQGGGRRGLGERRGRAQDPSHGGRDQLRPRGQPLPDLGPGRRLGGLRPLRGALRRVHGRQRPHGGAQLPQLPHPAARGNAENRDGDRAELRFLGRSGRADDLRGGAFGDERDLRGDRQAGAEPSAEERQARVEGERTAIGQGKRAATALGFGRTAEIFTGWTGLRAPPDPRP